MVSVLVHWAACLAFDQVGRCKSITIHDAAENVGVGGLLRAALSLRFTATVSRPSLMIVALMIVALVQAGLRASASETDGYDPRVKFFLLPWMMRACVS